MARAIEPGVKPGVESDLRAKSLKIARWGGNVRGRVLARLARLCPGERGAALTEKLLRVRDALWWIEHRHFDDDEILALDLPRLGADADDALAFSGACPNDGLPDLDEFWRYGEDWDVWGGKPIPDFDAEGEESAGTAERLVLRRRRREKRRWGEIDMTTNAAMQVRGTVNGVEARARIRERLQTFVDEKRGSLNRIGKALNISSGNLSVFLRNGKGMSPERLERVSAYLAEHEHDRPEGTVAPLLAFPPVAKPVEGVPSGAEPETERIVAVAPLDYVCPRCGAGVPDPVETPYCHCGACGVKLVHTCRECGAVETRVDARFCCLCGKAF